MTDQNTAAEADADTVANRAAQVITRMGADIRTLTGERDRYRTAWRSARERAQAYGEGILRVVKDREQYQQWLKQAEERGVALERAMESTAADALRHRGCHRDLMAQCLRAERAEAEANELRRAAAVPVPPPAEQTALRQRIAEVLTEAYLTAPDDGAIMDVLADAVLPVLPEQTDRAALPLTAVERQFLTFTLDLASDEMASRGAEFTAEDEAALEKLRRVAAEEQPTETEAHPPEHTWAAELRDPLADEWAPGTRYTARDRAVNHLTHARSLVPTWKDGTPTQRRLVRATTTYIVEAEHTPPAVGEQPETQETRVECAHCWREIENRGTPSMGGNHHVKWVHLPGGFTVCFPQRGGDSPRAEPRTPE